MPRWVRCTLGGVCKILVGNGWRRLRLCYPYGRQGSLSPSLTGGNELLCGRATQGRLAWYVAVCGGVGVWCSVCPGSHTGSGAYWPASCWLVVREPPGRQSVRQSIIVAQLLTAARGPVSTDCHGRGSSPGCLGSLPPAPSKIWRPIVVLQAVIIDDRPSALPPLPSARHPRNQEGGGRP